jgi:hypothetical protein
MLQRLFRPHAASPLSLKACLVIATVFWIHVSIARSARWELLRQAIADAGISPPDQIALASALLFIPLWLLCIVSWRVGYELSRWPKILAANLSLALVFGTMCRFAMFTALTLLHEVSFMDAVRILDGIDSERTTKFWAAGMIEYGAQYLVLQGILAGAAFYVRLREEQALRERLAREYDRTRLQVLRMQTNPHFLFNTLSAIAGLIRPQPQAAEAMVTRLGELFRATLAERDSEFITLQRELQLGEQYLEIQRARFAERFNYRIEVSGAAADVLVPTLLLQPLLENAAEHGLTTREGTVEVVIHCALLGERVHIVVSNPAEAAPRAERRGTPRGFGLENVRQRLRAAFGDGSDLTARLTAAGVFEVRVEFPPRFSPTQVAA